MKKLQGMTLTIAMAAFGFGFTAVHASAAVPPPGYVQDRWDAVPPELSEAERRGFRDGIEGAHKDAGNHRAFDVNNREEYQHPHVPQRDREAYRHGFERGYQAGVDHMNREHRW
jgi:ribosome modulation factor